MKRSKRIFAVILSIIMVISILPIIQKEVKAAATYGDFMYELLADGTAKVTRYIGDDVNVVIPDEIEGYSVTCIGTQTFWTNYYKVEQISIPDSVTSIEGGAFLGCSLIQNIKLPYGLKTIGELAFAMCESLTEIEIPDTVMDIGHGAFQVCSSLKTVKLPESITEINMATFSECEQLDNVIVPGNVTSIQDSAFWGCKSLQKITLPVELKSIGATAFYACSQLQNIEIPDGVTSIEAMAFWDCDSLTNIKIPKSVTNMSGYVFYDCDKLQNIEVDKENQVYCSLEGNLYNHDKTSLIQYAIGKKQSVFTIPNGVERIELAAFYNCNSIETVHIPNSVKAISGSAFEGCNLLSEVKIPQSVTFIGGSAFPANTTIHGYRNSAAQKYAEENGNKFIYLGIRHLAEEPELLTDDTIKFALYNKEAIAEANVFENHYAEYTEVENAHVRYSDYDIQLNDSKIEIDYDSIDTALCFQGEDYRNYTIPQEVIESWKTNEERTADIYMAKDTKDGKPYVSTVFARVHTADNLNKYVEVQTNKVQLLKNETYDVIISAEGIDEGAEYYLSQDTTHKVYNNTGIFTKMDLFSRFEKNKKIYAYVKTADGTTSEPIELRFEKYELDSSVENLMNKSSFSLLGPGRGANYFTIPDTIPLIGGAGIGLSNITFPLRFEVDNDRVKCVFGVKLNKNKSDNSEEKSNIFQ